MVVHRAKFDAVQPDRRGNPEMAFAEYFEVALQVAARWASFQMRCHQLLP
jgi:hypothetical protein